MSIEKKRNFLHNFCGSTLCRKCALGTRVKVPGAGWTIDCPNVRTAVEADLDKSLEVLLVVGQISPDKLRELNDLPPIEEDPVAHTENASGDDPVNHPSHYTSGGIECLEAIKASMDVQGFADFLKGQVIKYVWRYQLKGKPLEDLKKARFYLDRLIKEWEDVEK